MAASRRYAVTGHIRRGRKCALCYRTIRIWKKRRQRLHPAERTWAVTSRSSTPPQQVVRPRRILLICKTASTALLCLREKTSGGSGQEKTLRLHSHRSILPFTPKTIG